jgi:aminoglycoside/choline kinase family phosphotransferase
MGEKKQQIVALACRLLGREKATAQPLSGDGSQRLFWRLCFPDGSHCIAILPGGREAAQMAEARSAWLIGGHLHRAGVPVPEPFAHDPDSGLILCEDLGEVRLYDHLHGGRGAGEGEVLRLYGEAVRELARMQIRGGEGFQESWCWQTARYDRELMLERESGYFLQALCRDLLGLEPDRDALAREFASIADRAAAAPATYFLHRDYQSRNLMLTNGTLRIIDFQGGRRGPLAYDLASLLIDPYVGLPERVQEELLEEYLQEMVQLTGYDPDRFREEYRYLALQRNLQILGAFAFLGGQRGKGFFLPFIGPALRSLGARLASPELNSCPVLIHLVETCQERLKRYGD